MMKTAIYLTLLVGLAAIVTAKPAGGGNNTPGCARVQDTPPGYEHHPGLGYYKMHPYGASWCMANQICQEEKAQLLVLNSETEVEMAKMMMAKYPKFSGTKDGNSNWAWVGIHEKGKHGEFYTVQGEPLVATGFTRWYSSYPTLTGASDCGCIYRLTAELADDNCVNSWAFICEIPETASWNLDVRSLA